MAFVSLPGSVFECLRPWRQSYSCTLGTNKSTADQERSIFSSPETIQWLSAPVYLKGAVEHGFGRGSRKLGTPTANLSPTLLVEDELSEDGVYVGFARVPELDTSSHKMVLNLGLAKTFGDLKQRVLEAYIMHEYEKDFYGLEMRLCVLGFLRSEVRFDGIKKLKDAITNDVEVAKRVLDSEKVAKYKRDPYLCIE